MKQEKWCRRKNNSKKPPKIREIKGKNYKKMRKKKKKKY